MRNPVIGSTLGVAKNPCIWCDRFPVRFANASNVTTVRFREVMSQMPQEGSQLSSLEHLLDVGHFAFVHGKTFGDRTNPEPSRHRHRILHSGGEGDRVIRPCRAVRVQPRKPLRIWDNDYDNWDKEGPVFQIPSECREISIKRGTIRLSENARRISGIRAA